MSSRYSPEQKALAVQIIRRYGGMTVDAIGQIREMLGNESVSTSTLHQWLKMYGHLYPATETENTETPNRKPETKPKNVTLTGVPVDDDEMQKHMASADQSLDIIFEKTVRAYLTRANDPEAIKDTKGKDAVIAAATALDKMRLLRGLPTEIVSVVPDLLIINDLLRQQGKTIGDVIAVMKHKLTAGPVFQ